MAAEVIVPNLSSTGTKAGEGIQFRPVRELPGIGTCPSTMNYQRNRKRSENLETKPRDKRSSGALETYAII